jgi:hypothetical protein
MLYEKYFILSVKNKKAFFVFNALFWPLSIGVLCLNFLTPQQTKQQRNFVGPESARVQVMLDDLKSKSTYQKITDSVDSMDKFMLPTKEK